VVADPRSAGSLQRLGDASLKVFDAYDAWDLSPLFSGRPRIIDEIRRGYVAAAAHADLVIANSPTMAERMKKLGAARVVIIPNGAPEPRPLAVPFGNVLYVGNIQSRLRMDLMHAAARVAESMGRSFRIVGSLQEEPEGWSRLMRLPSVSYGGALYGDSLDREFAAASVGVVPHVVDDYTASQDAMKTWQYLAAGLSVVTTSVPPAASVPKLVSIADDPTTFGAAITDALSNFTLALRRDRSEAMRDHTWRQRALSFRRLVDLVHAR
jgi:glycosyltransferase involved in cell wall biosynthesis